MSEIKSRLDVAQELVASFESATGAISKHSLSEGKTGLTEYVIAQASFNNMTDLMIQFAESVHNSAQGIVAIAERIASQDKDMAGYGGQP